MPISSDNSFIHNHTHCKSVALLTFERFRFRRCCKQSSAVPLVLGGEEAAVIHDSGPDLYELDASLAYYGYQCGRTRLSHHEYDRRACKRSGWWLIRASHECAQVCRIQKIFPPQQIEQEVCATLRPLPIFSWARWDDGHGHLSDIARGGGPHKFRAVTESSRARTECC